MLHDQCFNESEVSLRVLNTQLQSSEICFHVIELVVSLNANAIFRAEVSCGDRGKIFDKIKSSLFNVWQQHGSIIVCYVG